MLKTRIVTALCLLAVFLISLLWLPSAWFSAFIGIVLLAAAWEWANLSGFQGRYHKLIYCIACVILALCTGYYVGLFSVGPLDQSKMLSLFLTTGVWWALALLWVQGYPSSAVLWGSQWMRALIGLFVLIPSGFALIFIRNQPEGAWLILLVVIIVAAADTGAYFSGKAFGQRKLAKEVSPGKSWEGVFGGLLVCSLLTVVMTLLFNVDSWLTLLFIVIPTALVSVLGDLLESMVKRHRGIKDSGNLLPGHGGVLDRIDGLTAAVPIFALAIILSGWQIP